MARKSYDYRGYTLVCSGQRVAVKMAGGVGNIGPVLLDCPTLDEAIRQIDLTRKGHPLESRALRPSGYAPLPLFHDIKDR